MSPLGKFKTDDRRHVEIVENGVFAERRRGRGGPNTVQGEAERNQSREGKEEKPTKMTRFSRAMGMGVETDGRQTDGQAHAEHRCN